MQVVHAVHVGKHSYTQIKIKTLFRKERWDWSSDSVAQWERALAAQKTWLYSPAPTWQLTTMSNYSHMGANTVGLHCIHAFHRHACKQKHPCAQRVKYSKYCNKNNNKRGARYV